MTAGIPTTFIDIFGMMRWVQAAGVEPTLVGMAREIERDYLRWQRFDKVPRVATHSELGVIELMPTSDGEEYAFKYVNGHPLNPQHGFQTVAAFGVLADVDNGYPTFFAEMTLLTALRTAAISGLVASYLARPDSRVMGMIGTGAQSEFQALAMRSMLGINDLKLFDVDSEATAKARENLENAGFEVQTCDSPSEAARGTDIITTCTADKRLARVLHDVDVAPGMHINAVGGDCPGKTELDKQILYRGPVFVELEEQTRIEGEIQQVPADFPVIELWELFSDSTRGRTSPEQVTIFDSVGFAISDFSALRYVRDAVRGSEFEKDINFIANPHDPKDLYSLVSKRKPASVPAS